MIDSDLGGNALPPLSYWEALVSTFRNLRRPMSFLTAFGVARLSPRSNSRLLLLETRSGTYCLIPAKESVPAIESFCCQVPSLIGDLGPRPLVIDIGAHVGTFALSLLEHHKGAKVLAFEPSPDTYELLRANIYLNDLEDCFTAHRCAVAGESGVRVLEMRRPYAGGNRLAGVGVQTAADKDTQDVEVEILSLSDVFRLASEEASLVKVDCEGAEYELFGSADVDVIRRAHKYFVEYHPSASGDFKSLSQKFESANFARDWNMPSREPELGIALWSRT